MSLNWPLRSQFSHWKGSTNFLQLRQNRDFITILHFKSGFPYLWSYFCCFPDKTRNCYEFVYVVASEFPYLYTLRNFDYPYMGVFKSVKTTSAGRSIPLRASFACFRTLSGCSSSSRASSISNSSMRGNWMTRLRFSGYSFANSRMFSQ